MESTWRRCLCLCLVRVRVCVQLFDPIRTLHFEKVANQRTQCCNSNSTGVVWWQTGNLPDRAVSLSSVSSFSLLWLIVLFFSGPRLYCYFYQNCFQLEKKKKHWWLQCASPAQSDISQQLVESKTAKMRLKAEKICSKFTKHVRIYTTSLNDWIGWLIVKHRTTYVCHRSQTIMTVAEPRDRRVTVWLRFVT